MNDGVNNIPKIVWIKYDHYMFGNLLVNTLLPDQPCAYPTPLQASHFTFQKFLNKNCKKKRPSLESGEGKTTLCLKSAEGKTTLSEVS